MKRLLFALLMVISVSAFSQEIEMKKSPYIPGTEAQVVLSNKPLKVYKDLKDLNVSVKADTVEINNQNINFVKIDGKVFQVKRNVELNLIDPELEEIKSMLRTLQNVDRGIDPPHIYNNKFIQPQKL